jgi:hypothetical protein
MIRIHIQRDGRTLRVRPCVHENDTVRQWTWLQPGSVHSDSHLTYEQLWDLGDGVHELPPTKAAQPVNLKPISFSEKPADKKS